jgi:mycoredoxin-dependent peroxiredoxin
VAAELGGPAPDFSLTDQHGTPVRLSALRGRPVLIVFFPWAFSGICGGELRAVRDAHFEDAAVVAISVDSMFALRVFSDAEGFDFPMLADCWPHGEVASLYGVFDESMGVARRGSFVVDHAGILRWSVVNGIGEARDLEDYRRALADVGRLTRRRGA